jgi:hypothetical protein
MCRVGHAGTRLWAYHAHRPSASHRAGPGTGRGLRSAARRRRRSSRSRTLLKIVYQVLKTGPLPGPGRRLSIPGGNHRNRSRPTWPQSFRGSGVWLLIVLTPVLGIMSVLILCGGRARCPVRPGARRLRPRRGGPPSVSCGWFVLVRRVRAGRRAAASRRGMHRPMASRS